MTVDREGNLYIVDEEAHRVLKYDRGDNFYSHSVNTEIVPGSLYRPSISSHWKMEPSSSRIKPNIKWIMPPIYLDSDTIPFSLGTSLTASFAAVYDGSTILRRWGIRREDPYPFQRENEEQAQLSLKANDYTGNLYFVDSETLTLGCSPLPLR